MSDKWEIYHAEIEGQTAFIYFDDGISGEIEQLDLPNLLKLQLAFRSPAENGMAGEDELVALSAIEEEVASWAADTGAAYVGRVTGAGCRTYICYTAHDEDDAAAFAEHLTMQSGYQIGIKLEEEPGKQTYWNALYPEPEERPQTSDMKVIKQLEAYNDNLSSPRRIDHFAYFDSRQQIEMFASWARRNGFLIDQMTTPSTEISQHMLVFHHDCRPLPEEISTYTLSVAANANRLGGEYAGWTTTAQAR